MKLNDILYKAPEMTEERLLEIIEKRLGFLDFKDWSRNKYKPKQVLEEYDLIQEKKSKLTRSQRNQILGFISACLIEMSQNNEADKSKSSSKN